MFDVAPIISGYEHRRFLGRGWYGRVHLMHHLALNEERAVKVVIKEHLESPEDFFRESQIMRQLKHSRIVEIHDAFEDQDFIYMSMEFCANGSIESLSAGKPLSVSRAIRYISDISYGLEYAHSQNIVHRDVKPGNLLIDSSGKAKISDFGLACKLKPEGKADGMGYPAHKAPEMITEEKASKFSDIYGMGMTLYRLVNGDSHLLFLGENLEEKIIAGKFPDRTKYKPFIPTKLRRVINKALHVEPSKRHKSIGEFRNCIGQVKVLVDWVEVEANREYIGQHEECFYTAKCWKTNTGKFKIDLTKETPNQKIQVKKDCVEFNDEKSALLKLEQTMLRIAEVGK